MSDEYSSQPLFEPKPGLSTRIEENVNEENELARGLAERFELQEKASFKSVILSRSKTGRRRGCTIDSEEGKGVPYFLVPGQGPS